MLHGLLLARIFNVPLYIAESKLEAIVKNVGIKLISNEDIPAYPLQQKVAPVINNNFPGTQVIKVSNSLVAKNGVGDSGITTYENMYRQITNAVNEGTKNLVFYVDSPGGEAAALFGLTDFINSLPAKYKVNTYSYTDGMMTSAAYAIGSATQKIVASELSIVGGIASIMKLVDLSKQLEANNIVVHTLRSKSEKALGSQTEGYSEEALAKLQSMLMQSDKLFNEKVNLYRPALSVQDIINLKGKDVMTEEALQLKLIDSVSSSFQTFMETTFSKKQSFVKPIKKGTYMTLEELQAENATLKGELATLKLNVDNKILEAVKAETDRCLGIMQAAATYGVSFNSVERRIKAKASVEASTEIFEELKAESQKETQAPTAPPKSAASLHSEINQGFSLDAFVGIEAKK